MAKQKKETNLTEIKYAETLYCEKGVTPQTIAQELNRNIKTIYAWRDKYLWDDTKTMFETSPAELKKLLLKEMARIAKGEKRIDEEGNTQPNLDADALSKLMKAYDYMTQKLSPEVIKDVFIGFDKWMSSIDAAVAVTFTQYHKQYLLHIISCEN
jgi:hypothetical protein